MSESYTWSDATKDLALLTHLTLQEAGEWVKPLQDTDLSPHDTVYWLVEILSGDPRRQGGGLYALLLRTKLETPKEG